MTIRSFTTTDEQDAALTAALAAFNEGRAVPFTMEQFIQYESEQTLDGIVTRYRAALAEQIAKMFAKATADQQTAAKVALGL